MLPVMTRPMHLLRSAPALSLALAAGFALLAAPALANDLEVAVDNQKVVVGKGKPTLKIKLNKAIKRIRIDLEDGKGRHQSARGAAQKGKTVKFPLPHTRPGKRVWQGKLDVTFYDGATGSMPLRFETQVLTSFKFKTTSSPRDIQDEHKVVIVAERPVKRLEVEAYGDNGVLIASTGQDFPSPPAGTPLEMGWVPGREGPVLMLKVTAHDESGFHRSLELYPHTVSVEHEEVVFDTGKWDIRPSEEQKLKDALERVKVAVRRYSKAVSVGGKRIRFFVSGHTDTVGPAGSNEKLSWNRARAIGKWFKDHGVGVPVYVRGFGESALKVPTPDETDEEQNRRADYDIGVDGPTGSVSGWSRL